MRNTVIAIIISGMVVLGVAACSRGGIEGVISDMINGGNYQEAENKIHSLIEDNEIGALQSLVDNLGEDLEKLLVEIDNVDGIVFPDDLQHYLGEMHLYYGSIERALELGAIDTDSYIKENCMSLDVIDNGDYSTFSFLDEELDNHKVFLAGEHHGIADNTKLELKFLKYFVQEAGVNYYLIEKGYSDSIVLNQYLETGDVALLERLFESYTGTFYDTEEQYSKWKDLYEFNQSLPMEKKIKVVGIDIEFGYGHAIEQMYFLVDKNNIPTEIKSIITDLITFYEDNQDNLANPSKSIESSVHSLSNSINKSIESNQTIYEEYFQDDFFAFNLMNKNILAFFEAQGSGEDFNKIRDERIYTNFLEIHSKLDEGKYFGQWGMEHVFQKPTQDVDWFATSLNSERSPLKGEVLSIIYLYDNCIQGLGAQTGDINTFNHSRYIFQDRVETNHTIFRLTGENSPFVEKLIWPLYYSPHRGMPHEDVTTDYFQYIVVIRDSDSPKYRNK